MAEVAERVKLEINWDAKTIEAVKQLKDQRSLMQNSACSYVLKGGDIYVDSGSVCHSFLHGKKAKVLVNSLQTGEHYGENPGRILPKETELWFVDYILNRSPYAKTFITKDAEEALEEGITVSSGDHPGNLVGGAVVALRRLWEHVYVAQAAFDLAKAGVNEDLAFLLGHCIQSPSKIADDTSVSWSACLNWHTSIDPGVMGFKAMKAFLDHEPTGLHKTNYVDSGSYNGYSNMFGVEGGYSGYVSQQFPYNLCKDQPKVSATNPFAASLPKKAGAARSAPYAKAIEVMAEWANTHLMEKIQNA